MFATSGDAWKPLEKRQFDTPLKKIVLYYRQSENWRIIMVYPYFCTQFDCCCATDSLNTDLPVEQISSEEVDWRKVSEMLGRKRKAKDYQRHWSNLQRTIALGILVENGKGQMKRNEVVPVRRDKLQSMSDDRRLLEYLRDNEVEQENEICWADVERDLLLPLNDARKWMIIV